MDVFANFLANNDPALAFRWRVLELPLGLDPRHVEKVSLPFSKFEAIPIYYGGTNNYYTSITDTDPIQVSLYETHDYKATAWIMSWRKLMWDEVTGKFGLPSEYKFDLSFELLSSVSDSIGVDKVVGTATGLGCWPSSVDNLEYSYDNSDRLILSCTLHIDHLTMTIGGAA